MWKSKKWDEEVSHWKTSMMILALALISIAFMAGKNSNFPVTGQIAANAEFNMLGLMVIMAFLIGLYVGKARCRRDST